MSDIITTSDFLSAMVSKLRAHDIHGVWKNIADEKLLSKWIIPKAERRKTAVDGAVKPEILGRIRLFYETVAVCVEKRTGTMTTAALDIGHEGFGRAFVITERLIACEAYLRDVHRYGFNDLDHLAEQGDAAVEKAVGVVEEYLPKMKG